MEQQILVRNGLMATEYLLTDRYFKPDPELHLEPLHGDAAVRMSPYTEGFFYDCYDRINYSKHHWDILAILGEVVFPGRIPEWFKLKDVVDRLTYLVHHGDIKIWKLKNQRLRFIAPLETDEEALSAADVNKAIETNADPEAIRLKRLHDAKVAKEKARNAKPPAAPPPLEESEEKKKARTSRNDIIAMRSAAEDRKEITKLAKEGKINEARKILAPQLEAAKNAKSPEEKKAALDAIIERLDVSSTKEKVFWSGDKKLAGKYAEENGKIILEQTPGGSVLDEWDEMNDTFSWNPDDMAPHGWDLWGNISKNYADGASGDVETIQLENKYPKGGPTWLRKEWPSLHKNPEVGNITVIKVDESGNILDSLTVDSKSDKAKDLFSE